ncbi:demethylmenaquinone methyltransferase [Leptospira perolatii]|uniref:Demethylmenaquinone methyltransferase n=1 Tax=Leptospira perolatii TaxID=2023191 RepID=A0A2M9ZPN8_9LEPT|nr:ubiquinone/menaquinone biosynthesis methyltransferase [Leptospira perolatii]PJZ70917.1 demethylmenaquinone methyltransferase [Leptospira perolatii]PJZ74040.1 demethylmenaquinone methyltransferase [Leptospira perolatii]
MPSTDTKASFVKENFNQIARKYDLFNDLNSFFLHRIWKNHLVKEVEKETKGQLAVLDLCCGTGDISLRFHKSKRVDSLLCIDFSSEMLEIAKSRLKEPISSGRAVLKIEDATNLKSVPNNSLDAVSIGFGLRNVDNLPKALSEIYRILKPGGVFANLDVGKVKSPIISNLANFYFFKIVPLLGYLIWGGKNEMFDYLPVSSLNYPDQESLKAHLEQTGFLDVRYRNFVFGNVALHLGKKPLR